MKKLYLSIAFSYSMLVASSADSALRNACHFAAEQSAPWHVAVQNITAYFKGTPYQFVVDQFYDFDRMGFDTRAVRCDAMDCMSYVEMVLALAVASQRCQADCSGQLTAWWRHNPYGLLSTQLARIMFMPLEDTDALYGKASIITRHRFIDAEWVRGNKWLLEDVTQKIYPEAPYTGKQLTKKELLMRQVVAYSKTLPTAQAKELVAFYTGKLIDVSQQTALTYYVPARTIIENMAVLKHVLKQPHIMTVVVEKPKLREQVGSHYNVTHLGFVLVEDDKVLFRHATYKAGGADIHANFSERVTENQTHTQNKVVDVELAEYLAGRLAHSTWESCVLGIQLLRIRHPNEWRLLQ